VAQYRAGVEALRESYAMTGEDQARIAELSKADVPEELARDMVLLTPLAAALDVALLAHDTGVPPGKVAPLYFALGERLGLDRLRAMAGKFSPPELLRSGMDVEDWAKTQSETLERTRDFLNALEASGELSVAKLLLASSQIQNLG